METICVILTAQLFTVPNTNLGLFLHYLCTCVCVYTFDLYKRKYLQRSGYYTCMHLFSWDYNEANLLL